MKKLILVIMSTLYFAIFSMGAQAGHQQAIKDYLEVYKNMLTHIANNQSAVTPHLRTGDYNDLDTQQLNAAIEVLQLIVDDKLDACCWRPLPNKYTGFPTLSDLQIFYRTTVGYTDSFGNTYKSFRAPTSVQADRNAIEDMLAVLPNNTYSQSSGSTEKMKYYELELLKKLKLIWSDLYWSFSYVDDQLYTDPVLKDEFRDRYAFACLVCFGAGYYDTKLLHTKSGNSYTATTAYDGIYAQLTTATKNWMTTQASAQYPDSITWVDNKAPLQLSTGPTYQGTRENKMGSNVFPEHMYPTHCHGSTELYKTLDPIEVIRDKGTTAQKNTAYAALPYTQNPPLWVGTYVSKFGEATFVKDMYPEWYEATEWWEPHYLVKFKDNNIGAMFYNHELDYHAMHNGRWMMLTQWARLTSPAEGTSFPLHGMSQPDGGTCQGS